MSQLRFLTAGESHGPELTAILEGMPAGVPLDITELNHQMSRRQKGYGSGGRMKIEQDAVHLTAGFMNGVTTGGPIAIRIENKDFAKWQHKEIPPMTIPRPGHADLTASIKYGYPELRISLERASARETAARVAVGAICKQLLSHFKIEIGSYIVNIGGIAVHLAPEVDYPTRFAIAESNDVRCPDETAVTPIREKIRQIMSEKDTLGGIFECVALNLPPGLGSHVHWDRRLTAQLMFAIGSIQAIKGVEIGEAFIHATQKGTEVHDELFLASDGDHIYRKTNRSGGFEGGITTGAPLIVRAAMKPISTVLNPRQSVNLATGKAETTIYERSDFCAAPRAAVVGEAMMAITLLNSLLDKLGGDSLSEITPRFQQLRENKRSDLPMDNQPWSFGY